MSEAFAVREHHQRGDRVTSPVGLYLATVHDSVNQDLVNPLACEVQSRIRALDFSFDAQGIYDQYGTLVKYELLARFYRPDGTKITPDIFNPIIEQIEYKTLFDYQVVKRAFSMIRERKDGSIYTININPSTFEQGEDFLRIVDEAREASGIDPQKIVFEILETEPINDYTVFNGILGKLLERWYRTAVDDFHPVGNHNMFCIQMLEKGKIDIVKLDGDFVEGLYKNQLKPGAFGDQERFRKALRDIARLHPHTTIVLEKVETIEELHFFQKIDTEWRIDCIQGYCFAHPVRFTAE